MKAKTEPQLLCVYECKRFSSDGTRAAETGWQFNESFLSFYNEINDDSQSFDYYKLSSLIFFARQSASRPCEHFSRLRSWQENNLVRVKDIFIVCSPLDCFMLRFRDAKLLHAFVA